MKRLLMITSAIGLCLAAPAFAQSTDQDQLNRQRATSPSAAPQQSSSPSQQRPNQPPSQAQDQQPSSGSSAQAPSSSSNRSQSAQTPPADQNRGQAQSQQPSGNMNAQAPADQQKPQRSATDKNRPAQSGQAQNQMQQDRRQNAQSDRMQNRQSQRDAAQSRDRSSASLNVNINETQRTRIASVISSGNVRPVNVNFRLATGVIVPRTVALHVLPASIIEIVPQYRGYSYFVTNEQIVIVEPRKKTVVAMLPAGGGAARAQAPSTRTTFTDQQRQIIRQRATTLRSTETTGFSSPIVVEQEVPATIELQEFPAEIVTEVPAIQTYRYFRQNNDIVVVDPGQRRVIEVIR